jgi:hypothetical protein
MKSSRPDAWLVPMPAACAPAFAYVGFTGKWAPLDHDDAVTPGTELRNLFSI